MQEEEEQPQENLIPNQFNSAWHKNQISVQGWMDAEGLLYKGYISKQGTTSTN